MAEGLEGTGLSYLEGILCWPDGEDQTPFIKSEVELRLYGHDALDPTEKGELLTWDDLKDKDPVSSTTSDEDTGYFWFPKPDDAEKPLDLLAGEKEKEFWIAAQNCVILTPWGKDKVINIAGGGVLGIKVHKDEREGKKDKKGKKTPMVVTYVWSYQRYPGPKMKRWQDSHMVKLEIPDEKPKTERKVKAFYIIPFAKYKEDGTWNVDGFKLEDNVALMFNPSTTEDYPLIPSVVLDCSKYPSEVDKIYKSAVADFYAFGPKFGEENKLLKFAYKQDGTSKQVPFGNGVCYNEGDSRIELFEYSYDDSGEEKKTLTFYSPFKPQYTNNTSEFNITDVSADILQTFPQIHYSSLDPPMPTKFLYKPLENISGAILNEDSLLNYNLDGIAKNPDKWKNRDGDFYSHEYYFKGFYAGRLKDRRGGSGSYRMHWGLDMQNFLTATAPTAQGAPHTHTKACKGAPNYAMCHGIHTRTTDPKGGNIASIKLMFPDRKFVDNHLSHLHSYEYNPALKNGQRVFAGELLAYSGDSGNASGADVKSKHMHTRFVVNGEDRNPAKIFLSSLPAEPSTNTQPANDDDPVLNEYRINVHPVIKGHVTQAITGTNPALAEASASGTAGPPAEKVSVEVYDGENRKILYSKALTNKQGDYIVPAPPRPVTIMFKKDGKERSVDGEVSLKTDSQFVLEVNVTDF